MTEDPLHETLMRAMVAFFEASNDLERRLTLENARRVSETQRDLWTKIHSRYLIEAEHLDQPIQSPSKLLRRSLDTLYDASRRALTLLSGVTEEDDLTKAHYEPGGYIAAAAEGIERRMALTEALEVHGARYLDNILPDAD